MDTSFLDAKFYAKQLLHQFGFSFPTPVAIGLYAKQLLISQSDFTFDEKRNQRRVLIITSNFLEQNVLSSFLRTLHITPVVIKDAQSLWRHINNIFDFVIISEEFKAIDIHALLQIIKLDGHAIPYTILIAKKYSEEFQMLGFDFQIQHPFILNQLKNISSPPSTKKHSH